MLIRRSAVGPLTGAHMPTGLRNVWSAGQARVPRTARRCSLPRLPRRCAVQRSVVAFRRMRTVGGRLALGWLAVTGPIAFTIAWILAEVLQDGYSPPQDYISELAALDARHPWIMITGFLWLGAGTVALGIGLAGALEGRLARIGSILVALAGVGIIVAGWPASTAAAGWPPALHGSPPATCLGTPPRTNGSVSWYF
jgi:Protein of unknown function (DUF998)